MKRRRVPAIGAGILCLCLCACATASKAPLKPIRIGYFHGGRTVLMLRVYENYEFEKCGVDVEFYTKDLHGREYQRMPRSIREFNKGDEYTGKARGMELINAILEGQFDLAMVGESSFIQSVYQGKPVVAIAELGHDVKNHSGHVILMRKGIKIAGPESYFGKVLVSRRAGPGDSIFLKEYLEKEGVDVKQDILQLEALPRSMKEKEKLPKDKVLIVDQVYEDELEKGVQNGVIDGGYFHLMGVPRLIGQFSIIRPLHEWANPELSHALLVCAKDFLDGNRPRLLKLLEAYIRRIIYEYGLSYEERIRPGEKGVMLAMNLDGLNIPQYDPVPTVDLQLLGEISRLLEKYGFLPQGMSVNTGDFVDNSLVLEVVRSLGVSEETKPPPY